MSPLKLLVVLSLALATVGANYDVERCPETPECVCKWISGKRVADCSNAGLMEVPRTLKPNIQTLKLDGNPIRRIERNAFKSANLLNLQKLSLRGCDLTLIDDGAFRDLKVLLDVDLSRNNLTVINHRMFDGNSNLQTIRMAHNPIAKLEAFQFPALHNLKRIDLSFCRIASVDRMAFKNLGHSVQSVVLNNNQLKSVPQEVFLPLTSLTQLQTHDNPWVCDCNLKNFRDWLIQNKLYGKATACAEPPVHQGKHWDQIETGQFACKPTTYIPLEFVFGSPGLNVTLSCLIRGSPLPKARWVDNGRVINNFTNQPFSNQMWIIREETLNDGFSRWYNLTITNPSHDNLGDYMCVAENSGGLSEQRVTLTFDDPSSITALTDDKLSSVILYGTVAAALLFITIMILLIFYCYCRRKRAKERKRNKFHGSSSTTRHDIPAPFGGVAVGAPNQSHVEYQGLVSPEESQSLLMPMQQHQHHLMPYMDVELRDLRANSVPSNLTTPRPQTSSSGEGSYHSSSTVEKASPQPDLLLNNVTIKKTSTPLNPQNLYRSAPSPAPSTISSVLTNVSFQRTGTLPLHYHPHCQTLNRVPVCTPSPAGAASLHGIVGLPHHHHHHHTLGRVQHQQQQRPGYVTLPRRPKASTATLNRSHREPIYDGIGPRTSADGSSKLSLSKTMPRNLKKTSAPPVLDPNKSFNGNLSMVAATGYDPITEEPKTLSTPNILDLNEDKLNGNDELENSVNNNNHSEASSEQTLLDDVSGYCEPFGKALPPANSNRNSVASDNGNEALSQEEPKTLPRKPSLPRNGGGAPKFRPIPPPKPRQRLAPGQVRKQFQDEGVDGSEV